MESALHPRNTQTSIRTSQPPPAGLKLLDCGSSLYDSFELRSFQHQLDSALLSSSSARTMSMPRLPPETRDDRQLHNKSLHRKPPGSKITRSLHKLVRSLFRKSQDASAVSYHIFGAQTKDMKGSSREGRYVFMYDKSGALSTIPEALESEHGDGATSPQPDSFVRKTRSERFTTSTSSIHIPSCA